MLNLFHNISRTFVGVFLAFFLLIFLANVNGETRRHLLNVRDFGAKGDGKADDTRAIQAAILEAEAQRDTVSSAGSYKKMGTSFRGGPYQEVFFPSGTYRISDTLVCERNSALRGEKGARIVQSNAEKDVVYFHGIISASVEKLEFQGGATQLHFWTNNRPAGLRVKDCVFIDAGRKAVECLSLAEYFPKQGEGWAKAIVWKPYLLERKDGWPQITPNPMEGLTEWFNSTNLVIEGSRFENCAQVADLQCDNAVISRCEVTTRRDAEGPVFRLAGKAHLSHVKGMARVNPEKDQYWVQGEGILSFRDLHLDSDAPVGWCLFKSQKRKNISVAVGHSTLIVDRCKVKSAGSREGAMVRISKEAHPSIISLTRNKELSGNPVQAIRWETPQNLESLKRYADVSLSKAPIEAQFMICVGENEAPIDESIPDGLQSLRQPPIPADALLATEVPPLTWTENDTSEGFDEVLYATDHGIRIAPDEDQTEAIQRLLDLAGEKGNCTVIFPATVFQLSKTLKLPPSIVLRGAGLPIFVQDDFEKDLFVAPKATSISMESFHIVGGKAGLSVTSEADVACRVALISTSFYDNRGTAIRVWSSRDADNQTEVLLARTSFKKSYQGLVTNAARAEIRDGSSSNHPTLNQRAFFENHGGQMRVTATLTNPYVWQGEIARKKSPYIPKDWALSNNLRWFDNTGKLFIQDVRFGGEDEGICGVYNRSEKGVVRIDGGFARFFNDANKKAIIYLEKPSPAIVLNAISGLPWRYKEGRVWMNENQSAQASQIYTSCVMSPQE